MKIIEIRGTGVVNKGAYLMLKGVLEEFKNRNYEVIFVVEETKAFPIEYIKKEGIGRKLSTFKKGFELSGFFKLIPFFLRKKLNWYLIDDVDIVLDASGFFMGDQWSPNSIQHKLGKDIQKLKKQKSKIVLLPQAFGPFNRSEIREISHRILQNVDLIFARDPISYKYLKELNISNEIYQFPDFTNTLERVDANFTQFYSKVRDNILIIPNQKIVEQAVAKKGEDYIIFLKHIIELIQNKNVAVKFLLHSGIADYRIAEEVNKTLDIPIEIIDLSDPILIKYLIGNCKGLITGRFHGLVSALSQGIPVLATSWSHKYEMLFKDYNYDGLLPVTVDKDVLNIKINYLTDNMKSEEISKNLRKHAKIEKSKTKQMWDKVFEII